MSHVYQPIATPFDLCGGHLALDFVNTLEGRVRLEQNDLLSSYDELLRFGHETDSLPPQAVQRLQAMAAQRPDEATAVLRRAIALREVIYRIVSADLEDKEPSSDDLALFNTELQCSLGQAGVVAGDGGFRWDWIGGDRLDEPVWPIARSALELLTTELLKQVKLCAAETCAWLFLDTSKNKSRRWCDMKVCGNRAKARAFHARSRAKGST